VLGLTRERIDTIYRGRSPLALRTVG
jgi:hypothetical protein